MIRHKSRVLTAETTKVVPNSTVGWGWKGMGKTQTGQEGQKAVEERAQVLHGRMTEGEK